MPFIYCSKCFKFHHDRRDADLYLDHMRYATRHKSGNPVLYGEGVLYGKI